MERGKGISRFIRNDYGKVPELKVSKIIEKYRHLTKCLEKKKRKKSVLEVCVHELKIIEKYQILTKCQEKKGFGKKGFRGYEN